MAKNQTGLRETEFGINGARYLPGFLSPDEQVVLIHSIKSILEIAPLFSPAMPRTGRPFSVRMSNCGKQGWVSDKANGYRYQTTHPETGTLWPEMPAALTDIWKRLTDFPGEPEACLINFYNSDARMGLHRDADEKDFSAPVISLSLGDSARFRLGGASRKGPTRAIKLNSGDALVLEGEARLAYHGVDRILAGSSSLVWREFEPFRRINLTLRRVT